MLHQRNAQNEASEYPTPCPHTVQRKSRGAIEHNCVDRGHNRIGGRLRAAVRFNQLCIRMSRTDRDVHSACGTFHAGPESRTAEQCDFGPPESSLPYPELPPARASNFKMQGIENYGPPQPL